MPQTAPEMHELAPICTKRGLGASEKREWPGRVRGRARTLWAAGLSGVSGLSSPRRTERHRSGAEARWGNRSYSPLQEPSKI